jgi:hypothetical protein
MSQNQQANDSMSDSANDSGRDWLFQKGVNSNPEGIRTAGGRRALEIADELAAEHGGWESLTVSERLSKGKNRSFAEAMTRVGI